MTGGNTNHYTTADPVVIELQGTVGARSTPPHGKARSQSLMVFSPIWQAKHPLHVLTCPYPKIGGNDPGRIRTCNPRLRRPMPYPLGHGAYSDAVTMDFFSPRELHFQRSHRHLDLGTRLRLPRDAGGLSEFQSAYSLHGPPSSVGRAQGS